MTTVSVGVPAYNEQANIKRLLESILSQKEDGFVLQEVIVVSDGSSDNTVSEVRSINDSRIQLVASPDRCGKIARFNQIVQMVSADVFVQFDADMELLDDSVIANIVKTMHKTNADLVSAHVQPMKPKTFFQQVLYFGAETWEHVLNQVDPETYLLHRTNGGCRAFSARYLQDFVVPATLVSAEDAYSFYYAKTHGLTVAFASEANVYGHLSTTFADYLKQIRRFFYNETTLSEFFPQEVLDGYNRVTRYMKLKALIISFLTHSPIISLSYIYIQLFAHLTKYKYTPKVIWDVSESTKQS